MMIVMVATPRLGPGNTLFVLLEKIAPFGGQTAWVSGIIGCLVLAVGVTLSSYLIFEVEPIDPGWLTRNES